MSQRFTSVIRTAASVNFVSSGAHTLAGWVFLQSNTSQQDICYGDDSAGGGGGNQIWMGVDNGFARFNESLGGASIISSAGTPLSLNVWHHLALTYSGSGSFHLFVDGVDSGPIAGSVAGRPNFNYFDIGYPGDMTLQDVFWIASELSAAQILQLMRQPSAFTASAYAAYALTNAAPTVDASGNGHTLSGAGDSNGSQILIYENTATTQVYGTATLIAGTNTNITAAGQTRVTGSAAVTSGISIAIAGSGSVQTTGTANVSTAINVPITADGLVRTSGFAVMSSSSPAAVPATAAKRSKLSRRSLVTTGRRRQR